MDSSIQEIKKKIWYRLGWNETEKQSTATCNGGKAIFIASAESLQIPEECDSLCTNVCKQAKMQEPCFPQSLWNFFRNIKKLVSKYGIDTYSESHNKYITKKLINNEGGYCYQLDLLRKITLETILILVRQVIYIPFQNNNYDRKVQFSKRWCGSG